VMRALKEVEIEKEVPTNEEEAKEETGATR
jgi:hypothetical protein